VQGILAAEKLARLDCASIPISSPPPNLFLRARGKQGNTLYFFLNFWMGRAH
jgi:hypothetical protein